MIEKNVLGNKPYFMNIDEIEGLDVDNPIDFEIANYLYKQF